MSNLCHSIFVENEHLNLMPLHVPVQVAGGAELETARRAEEPDLVLRSLWMLLLRVHHQVTGFYEELTLVKQVGLESMQLRLFSSSLQHT